ncbi:hypothetical protein B0I35DRAFT_364657 [Stachybotrys elegans]|uniref:N-acetyltransferase domain-containing protein n=1 Tax=Stachybotrys elegans TaxID=80388 RepID=A0A8K0WKP3_9HYPO|nr:hypothetical protein B0I35DRAFT_364657 [Stachybotrys elegans]
MLFGDDILLLLTPAVVPLDHSSSEPSDPFEPLGVAISRRYPLVRHVPYTKRHGITGAHVAFIKRAKVVIFVITDLHEGGGTNQSYLAEIVREACEERPLVLVACCEVRGSDADALDFPTLVQVPGFSPQDLRAITPLLVHGRSSPSSPTHGNSDPLQGRISWTTEEYVPGRDAAEAYMLWQSSVSEQFYLKRSTWAALLGRQEHRCRVVRHPRTGEVVGLCMTYTNYAFKDGPLVKSIAILVVRENYRGWGIGQLLCDEAVNRQEPHGSRVDRIQVGSTFPRLLYGIPTNNRYTDWFKRRGWQVDENEPGRGRLVSDWVLRFSDMPTSNLASAGLVFRPCDIRDVEKVRGMVAKESERKLGFGWYELYSKVLESMYMEDVLVGFEGSPQAGEADPVAIAITYIPNSDSPIATEMPLTENLGSDIGGVSCICIKDDDPLMVNRRDTVMVRLLHSCSKLLSEKGMVGMFIDGVKQGNTGFESLGFRKWAEYREVWRDV